MVTIGRQDGFTIAATDSHFKFGTASHGLNGIHHKADPKPPAMLLFSSALLFVVTRRKWQTLCFGLLTNLAKGLIKLGHDQSHNPCALHSSLLRSRANSFLESSRDNHQSHLHQRGRHKRTMALRNPLGEIQRRCRCKTNLRKFREKNYARWIASGRTNDFIPFMSRIYCPLDSNNWARNVSWWFRKLSLNHA